MMMIQKDSAFKLLGLALILAILLPARAYSENKICPAYTGVSLLAIQSQNYPVRPLFRSLKDVSCPGLQFLWGTFGTRMRGIRRFTERYESEPHLLAVNATNGSCERWNRCGVGEWRPGMSLQRKRRGLRQNQPRIMNSLVRRVQRIRNRLEAVANENTTLRLYIQLEDNWSNREYRNAYQAVREVWPYEIYRSGIKRRGVMGSDGLELHGVTGLWRNLRNTPAGCSWSNDGIDLNTGDGWLYGDSVSPSRMLRAIRRARREGCDVFIWKASNQGLSSNFIQPRLRSMSFTQADADLFNALIKED